MDKELIISILLITLLTSLVICWGVNKYNAGRECEKECKKRDLNFNNVMDRGISDFYCYCEEKTDKVFKLERGAR